MSLAEEPNTAESHSSHFLGGKVHMEYGVHCRVITACSILWLTPITAFVNHPFQPYPNTLSIHNKTHIAELAVALLNICRTSCHKSLSALILCVSTIHGHATLYNVNLAR